MLIISLVIVFPPLENEAATDPKNFMLVLISVPGRCQGKHKISTFNFKMQFLFGSETKM